MLRRMMMAAASANAKRWWRVYVTACETSTNGTSAAEIKLRSFSGGSNLAVGGSAVASSVFGTGYAASKAFDGDYSTFWSSATVSGPWWIGYKLPTAATINEITVQVRYDNTYGQGFKDFKIQSSIDSTTGADGTWVDEWAVTGQTGWALSETRTFTRP